MTSPASMRLRGRARLVRPMCGVLAASALLASAAAGPAAARVIVGTPGPDRLVGTSPGGDLLFGGGGANTLIGGPGNDVIYGVRSSNTIRAGAGDNYIEGGAGGDNILVAGGNNTIYGGSGLDTIVAGDGNNYVDPGGAPDRVTLGNGNNVLNGGSGGMVARLGNGDNTVYMLSGPDRVTLGHGVNTVYVASPHFASLDCGGNPQSALYVNAASDRGGLSTAYAIRHHRIVGCPNVHHFTGPLALRAKTAGTWQHYRLTTDDARAKLLGGHGGGLIMAGNGDNILWADSIESTGGMRARANTTRISAGNGDNQIYGGRGTNRITVGNGMNFIRAGAWNNVITVGSGQNVVNLQGVGSNRVTITGGSTYVASFANGHVPVIRCAAGALGTIVYGNTRPRTNCRTIAPARSPRGKRLQVLGVNHIVQSDPVVDAPLAPGTTAGIPRPSIRASFEALR